MKAQQRANIQVEQLEVGINTVIEPTATIRGIGGKARKVTIGDNCYIGQNVQIICDEFVLGDYCKIQHSTNIHGYKPCRMGHNLWMGQYTVVDSIGGMQIGNNCGIGAHSQLWSHIKYGDTLEGCRFLSEREMVIGNDVWFVGHCIVSPIVAADKSMALAGSVIVKNMEYNQIYSGAPAKSISEKIGFQFVEVSPEVKLQKMQEYLTQYEVMRRANIKNIRIVLEKGEIADDENTYFVVADRSYTKRRSLEEIGFMRFLLPEKAKFVPY